MQRIPKQSSQREKVQADNACDSRNGLSIEMPLVEQGSHEEDGNPLPSVHEMEDPVLSRILGDARPAPSFTVEMKRGEHQAREHQQDADDGRGVDPLSDVKGE